LISGENEGGLSIFRMNEGIDAGDILAQRSFPLTGRLQDIFDRIVSHGAKASLEIVQQYESDSVVYQVQENIDDSPVYKRRKPSQSEMTLDQAKQTSSKDLYNLIRALDDPYPNIFLELNDSRRLLMRYTQCIEKDALPEGSQLVSLDLNEEQLDNLYLETANGYCRLTDYSIVNRD
jgi:methionyl-tRNA formyltransferase